jgi:hypothetical protein
MAKPKTPPTPENQPPDPPKKPFSKPSKLRKLLSKPRKAKLDEAVEEAVVPPQRPERRLNLDPGVLMQGEVQAEEAKGKDKDLIDNLFAQAFDRWLKKEEANKGVAAIAQVVSFIQSGRSLKELDTELIPLLSEQASKSHILQATMYNHQMERVALHWSARWDLERSLWEDLRAQKLTPREKIALLELSTREAKEAAAYINNASAEFKPMTEVEPTIEKAGKHSASKAAAEKKKEFEGTTPQGREIIRRMTFKAKQAADKIVEAELDKKTDGGSV